MSYEEERAMLLLTIMKQLGDAAVNGEPIAQPYLDADAIQVVDGKPQFHKERFLTLLYAQMKLEKL